MNKLPTTQTPPFIARLELKALKGAYLSVKVTSTIIVASSLASKTHLECSILGINDEIDGTYQDAYEWMIDTLEIRKKNLEKDAALKDSTDQEVLNKLQLLRLLLGEDSLPPSTKLAGQAFRPLHLDPGYQIFGAIEFDDEFSACVIPLIEIPEPYKLVSFVEWTNNQAGINCEFCSTPAPRTGKPQTKDLSFDLIYPRVFSQDQIIEFLETNLARLQLPNKLLIAQPKKNA